MMTFEAMLELDSMGYDRSKTPIGAAIE